MALPIIQLLLSALQSNKQQGEQQNANFMNTGGSEQILQQRQERTNAQQQMAQPRNVQTVGGTGFAGATGLPGVDSGANAARQRQYDVFQSILSKHRISSGNAGGMV